MMARSILSAAVAWVVLATCSAIPHHRRFESRAPPSFRRSHGHGGSAASQTSKWDWKALESYGLLQKVIWNHQNKNPAFSEEGCHKMFTVKNSPKPAAELFNGCTEVCAKAKEVKKKWGSGGTGPLACQKMMAFGCPDLPAGTNCDSEL